MAAVGVLLIVLAYVFVRIELLYIGLLAFVLPVIAALYVWFRRLSMRVIRVSAVRSFVAGYTAAATIELSNLSPSATPAARWHESLPWQPHATTSVPLAGLRSGTDRATLRYSLTPPRRGVFTLGPLVVELSDPFGLARSDVAVGETQRIVVVPDIEALPAGGHTVSADDGAAHAQRFRTLSGDDDVTTRTYRRGDALRRVHWRASAHRGELMVREEEQHSHAEARIVLDTIRGGYRDVQLAPQPHEPQSEQFEWALRVAASLALNLAPNGFLVQFVETGAQQLAPPSEYEEFLESVASARLAVTRDSRSAAMAQASRSDTSLGVLFAIVADVEPATLDSLMQQRAQFEFEFAIALVVTPRFDEVAQQFASRGWSCIKAPEAESVRPLWENVVAVLEARSGR